MGAACPRPLSAMVIILVVAVTIGCGRSDERLSEWQRVKSGALDVVLLSPEGAPRHGRDSVVIEFRSASTGQLTDVGEVRASATMPMTGMPMIGTIDVTRTSVAGRYTAVTQLEMTGTWRIEVRWQGASPGSAAFAGTVQ